MHPRLHNKYTIQCLLGRGGSSVVYQASRHSDGVACAIKCLYKHCVPENRLAFDQDATGRTIILPIEVYLLRRLQHEHTIRLMDYFQDEDFFYIVTEYCGSTQAAAASPTESAAWDAKTSRLSARSNDSTASSCSTDLFELIDSQGGLTESHAMFIFRQIVAAVLYLRSRNVYHMDLKDENVVVDEKQNVKLIDFGSAHVITDPTTPIHSFYGTLAYATPEFLQGRSYLVEENEVWCLGTLLHTMLFGLAPWMGKQQDMSKIFIPISLKPMLSAGTQDLLQDMLAVDPHQRVSLTQLQEKLETLVPLSPGK